MYTISGKPSGECFVEFLTAPDLRKALLQHHRYLGRRYLEVSNHSLYCNFLLFLLPECIQVQHIMSCSLTAIKVSVKLLSLLSHASSLEVIQSCRLRRPLKMQWKLPSKHKVRLTLALSYFQKCFIKDLLLFAFFSTLLKYILMVHAIQL